ncbi:MAG: RyR domain-containing protein [Pseudomonadota bacterium]
MTRTRRLASAVTPWVLPCCAIATITLGFWGWLDHGHRIDDALYRAIALFAVNNEAYRFPPGSTDLRFLVGRWTGLLSVFGAALFALAALLQRHAVVALAQVMRRRVAVVGSGPIALKAFERARASGRGAVWIGAPALESHRLNAFALPWPAEDAETSIETYVADAEQVLVAHEDPAGSLLLAKQVRSVAPRALITVMLDDASLAEASAAMINEPRTRVITPATVSARALHVAHPPFLLADEAGHGRIHALIVGFGQSGQAIARDLIVNCRTTRLAPPRITVVDPAARALEGALRVRAPELDRCAEMIFIEGRISTQAVEPEPDALISAITAGGAVTAAYVCRSADADSLSTAAALQSLLRLSGLGDPPIFTRLRDAHTLTRSSNGRHGLNALISFGDLSAIVAASEFLRREPDDAARAFSEAYRSTLSEDQRNDPNNRSGRPWDELDETFRQATRDAVAHIPAKLASARIDPALWRGVARPPRLPPGTKLFDTKAEWEALAALEHERWNAQRRLDGWRWADLTTRDEARRLHPALAPYEDLPETTKAYDRALVEEVQAICGGAGPIKAS